MALNRYVLLGTTVGALGGLLFGFDTAVISGTTAALTQVFTLSDKQLGLTVSIALIGTIVGALNAGTLGQRIGGRNGLRIMAVLYLLSSVGCALAPTWTILLLARFLGGLGIGGCSVLGPVYIAELAPAHLRGRLVGTFQINIVLGILLAYLSNAIIAAQHLGVLEWRVQFAIPAIPALVFFALLYTIPQSARWLVTQNRPQEAAQVLHQLGTPNPQQALQQIEQSTQADATHSQVSLFQRRYRKPILLAVTLGLFNQLAGINAILYYLNDIFAAAGFSRTSANLQSVAIGATNLLFTLLAMTAIDRFGRKTLLLIGSVGMAFTLAGVAAVFASNTHTTYLLPLLIAYIAFFAASQGAVIWVYLAEIFPNSVRAKGQSLGSGAHWVMNALLSGIFPIVARHSHATPFVLFAAMMALQFVVILLAFPETKGASLEQLQHQLGTA